VDLRWAKNLRKLAPYKALLDFAFVVRSQMLYAAELRARKVQRYDTAIIMPQFPVSEMELFQASAVRQASPGARSNVVLSPLGPWWREG
jgi:hypothetical protein